MNKTVFYDCSNLEEVIANAYEEMITAIQFRD